MSSAHDEANVKSRDMGEFIRLVGWVGVPEAEAEGVGVQALGWSRLTSTSCHISGHMKSRDRVWSARGDILRTRITGFGILEEWG